MENQKNNTPERSGEDNWLDEILGTKAAESELGPDEQALIQAGLIAPEDAQLEAILQELQEELPQETQEPVLEELSEQEVQGMEEEVQEPTLFFSEVEAPQETVRFVTPLDPQELPEELTPVPETAVKPTQPEKLPEEPAEKPLPKRRPKMKKGYGLFGIPHILATAIWLVIVLAIGVSLGRMVWLCAEDVLALGKTPAVVTVTVEEEDDIEAVAQKLKDAGLIRYPGLFKQFAELTGKGEDIDPGTYTFNERMLEEEDFSGIVYDYNALIRSMQDYGVDQDSVTVVFPEGSNCAQIFAVLEEKGVCTVAQLEEYAANGELDDYWFLEGIQRGNKYCLEGYLCPDTYDFYTNDEPKRVLEKLLNEFDDRYTERLEQKFEEQKKNLAAAMAANGCSSDYIAEHTLTLHDVVVLASIVEKETASNLESFDFASLFYNRLADPGDFPYLNSKATMKYAEEYYYKGQLNTASDRENCEFNTDTQKGLISKPICNPSLNSMAAALGPKDTNYYYFVYDEDASAHIFSETLREHNARRAELGLE